MKRDEAFVLIHMHGGKPRSGVTRKTGVLVAGGLGWPLLADGRLSNSLIRARSYGVPIISEWQFLEWIGKAVPEIENKVYTADQLISLSKVSSELIDQFAMLGLIEPKAGLYGFRDLAATRQIANLLASGVGLQAITRSLYEIRKWLPDAGLSKLRLCSDSGNGVLIEEAQNRIDVKGQYVLGVSIAADEPDLLFQKAQLAEEANDSESAERLYQLIMKIDPRDAAAPFNLANLLRKAGKIIEAEAAYRTAVEAEPGFAPSWYNLAGLLDEQGRVLEATRCLKETIAADPDYADAVFNLALAFQRLNRPLEARQWWKRYLELDDSSTWSSRARRALKLCEIQNAFSA
jgi:tetratricopeptide (TPR) repeat protein